MVDSAGILDAAQTTGCPDAARRILDSCVVGTLAATQAIPPLLRKVPTARIVNPSGSLGWLSPECAQTNLTGLLTALFDAVIPMFADVPKNGPNRFEVAPEWPRC